nr:DUF3644 domain-containing protein [uncultured Methanolobus sp.]
MPRIPKKVKQLLVKSHDSALLAVEIYNKPAIAFRSYNYIILMCIAWLAFFHAYFEKKGIKYYYRERGSRRYVYIDGEKKSWDLSECVSKYFQGESDPVRDNLDFFIGLRNKIEHSYLPALDISICGECQALLLNYEKYVTKEFGLEFGLSESLVIPLQMLSVNTDWRTKVLKELQSKEYEIVQNYINTFRDSLNDDAYNSTEYSFKVFLIPKVGNRENSSDLSMEFIPYDSTSPEDFENYKKAITLIKKKQVPVRNPGALKPSDVCARINEIFKINGDKKFNASYHHSKCWKYYKVRPESNSENRTDTNLKYSHYDVAHGDYLYTDDWVDFLKSELSDSSKTMEIFGVEDIMDLFR